MSHFDNVTEEKRETQDSRTPTSPSSELSSLNDTSMATTNNNGANVNDIHQWIQHLSTSDDIHFLQALEDITHTANQGATERDVLLVAGVMDPLLSIVRQDCCDEVLPDVAAAIRALCNHKPKPPVSIVTEAVSLLCLMIQHPQLEVAVESLWALSNISDGSKDHVDLLVSGGVISMAIHLLAQERKVFQMPCIRIIGNMCMVDATYCQEIINAGCLQHMSSLLERSRPMQLKKETLWVLSNICAGNVDQTQAVFHAGLVTLIISSLGVENELAVRKEASWACFNIMSTCADHHLQILVEAGIIEALCTLLEGIRDEKIIRHALESLQDILNVDYSHSKEYMDRIRLCGGLNFIYALCSHENPGVADLAADLFIWTDPSLEEVPQ